MPRQKYQEPKLHKSGKAPNQRWKADYYVYVLVEGKPKRRHRQADFGPCAKVTAAAARRELAAFMQEVNGQTPKPDGRTTLAKFFEEVYLPIRRRRWSYNTKMNMECTLKYHVLPQLGGLALEAVTKTTIEKHLITLADAGFGFSILDRVRFLLHGAFREAETESYVERNPASRVMLPACAGKKEKRSLTEAEAQHLFASLAGQDRLLFRLMTLCGLRLGEALALRWNDLENGFIWVDESALRGQAATTKNKKRRRAPLAASLRVELEIWREACGNPAAEALIFVNASGRMIRRESTGLRILVKARAASGIPDLTFHMCRRTFATHIEGDVKDLAEILGHSKVDMTMAFYKLAIPERQMRAVEDLDRRFSGVLHRSEQNSAIN